MARKFWNSKTSVVFVWPGEEPLEITYDAMRFVVPPRNDVARPGRGSIYIQPGAQDTIGRYIPGTIVVEDVTDEREGGGFKPRLQVDLLCRFLERDRQDLFERGFNIVQDRNDIKPAMDAGLPLYNAGQDGYARQVLAAELERQKRYADKGQPAPPSSSAHKVEWAIKHLQTRPLEAPRYTAADITGVLEGRLNPATPPTDFVSAPEMVDLSVSVSNKTLLDQAEEAGVKLNTAELKGLLRDDPETIDFVVQKIKARAAEAAELRALEA